MKKVVKSIFATFIAIFSMANVLAANVAKIGDIEYATIDAAISAWKEGDVIELLCDIEKNGYFCFSKSTFSIDGKGHTVKCLSPQTGNSWRYFVNANGQGDATTAVQTYKNITFDANGKVPYVMQAINSGKLILDNVILKNGKTTKNGSTTALGYGIHINGGTVVANNVSVYDCEVAGIFLDKSSGYAKPTLTLTGDKCDFNVDAVAYFSSASPSVNVTADGIYSYEASSRPALITYKINIFSSLPWNESCSRLIQLLNTSSVLVTIKNLTVKLQEDVVFAKDSSFISNDSRLTVDGNGKTVAGKFVFGSASPSTVKNMKLGNGSVLDCTASTKTGFSSVSVAANTSIDILLPASTDMNSYVLPVALATDAVANIFVGDKKYIAKNGSINPAEMLAQIGDTQYATLQEAINAANGATVQVLKDVALTSSLTVPAGKTLTLNLAGRKVTVSGADYALVNNGNLTIVDMGLVTVVAAEATIGDETAAPILIMAPSANDGVAVIDDATGGSIAGVQNNGTFALESGAVVAASASVPAIDNTANAVATITGGTVEGKLQAVDKTALTITGGSFTGESNVSDFVGGDYGVDDNGTVISYVAQLGAIKYQTLQEAFAAAKEFDVVTVLDAEADVSGIAGYVAEGLFPISNGDKTYTLRAMPAATVEKLPAFTLTKARDAYACWPEGDTDIDRPLDIVMNFLANDDGKAEANETGFADWKCDFYLTFSDMAGTSLEADGCYLAGNYGGFGWIVIPADDTIIDNNATLPVVAAYDANITYRQVCDTVKKFTAAIHVADAVMTANPNLKITLQLKMTNNKDASQELVVGSYTYTIEDLKGEFNPTVKVEEGATVTDTFKATVGSGLANAYQAMEGKLEVTVVEQAETFATLDVSATDDYEVPAEGLEMTFPAQSVKDNEPAIIVHKHEGKYYVTTGLVEYGFVTYNNTLGFSEFIVGDVAALNAALAEGGEVILSSDIVLNETLTIPEGKTVTLDLNGKQITSGYQKDSTTKHIYPFDVYGTFTIKDTVGNGSITGRGIYVQAGAKLTIESGSIYAIDSNGGSALFMHGGDVVINGGHIEQKAEGTYNFAINGNAGTVTMNNGWVGGNHGAIAAGGATVVINGGTLVCTGTASMTDNVLYSYGTGSITINGGTFIGDSDTAAGGCCVYDANGGATINGGTFGNTSGGDVWGTTGTTIKGGTFSNLTETQHIADGFKLDENGQVVAKPAVAMIGETPYATLAEALNAAKAGDIVEIVASELVFDENAASIVIEKAITIKGAGADNTKLKFNSATSAFTVSSSNVTFKDLTIEQGVKDNSFHISISKGAWDTPAIQYQNILIENVKFAGSDYALCLIGENVVVKGCTFTDQDSHNIIIYSLKGESKIIDNTFNASKGNNKSAVLWEGGADNATDLTQFVGSGELVISGNTAISKGVFFQFTNWGLVKNVSVEISGNTIDAFTNKAIAIYDMDGAVKANGDEFGTFVVKNNVFTNVPKGRPILKEYTGTVEVDASENYLGSGEPVIDSLIVGEKVVVDSYYSDSELKTLVNCSAPAVTTGAELIDALEAGGNVKLGADIALKASDANIEVGYYAYVLLNNNVTLDLNGYTLSCAVNPNWDDDYYYVCIGGSAELIITDSVGNGKILAREQHISFESLYMDDGWTDVPSITVQGGTVNSIALSDGATFGVTGGNVTVYLHDEDYYYSYDEYKDYLESLTFTTDPTAYLPEGFNVVEKADGTFGFKEIPAVIAVAKIGDTPYTTLEAALNAAKAGDTVEIVVAGNYELKNNYVEEGAYRLPDNFTLKGMVDGVVVTNGPTIRANNLTIDNVDFNNPVQKNYQSGLVFYLTGNSVIKNSDIYGYWGASYYSVVTGTLLVDNCTCDTQVYGLHIAEGNADVTVKNSVIAGWNTYGSDIRVTFTGCTFKDNRGYHYLGFYGDAVIEDCKFEENVTIGSQTTDAIVIDISNSKVVDDNGDEIAEKSIYDIIEQETLDSDVVVKIDNIHVNGKVAKIGETTYATLAETFAAAQTGDTVTFLCDVEQTDGVLIADKKLAINLNGKTFTVSNGGSTNNRNFKINGASEVVISNGTMVAAGDYNSGAYGTVRTEGTAKVELQDLKLYNYRGNGLNVKACTGTSVTMADVEIYAQYGGGVEAAGGTIELTDVVVQQKGMYTAPYNSMAISVNGGGTVIVQSGTYSTECLTAEEANNQGTSHGPWAAGVLNSGGTLIINGGMFSNDNFGENSLATHARGAILADTAANIQINGGTFNALKAIVDIQNNLGNADKNPSCVLAGGTFSADPCVSANYGSNLITVKEGYLCAEQNSDPVLWKIGKLPSAEVVNLGPVEVGPDGDYTFGDNYYVYDLVGTQKMTTSNETFDLQIALNFIAKDTVAQAEKNAFGNYTTDFYITIDGIADGSFVADEDCYLAGYYPSFNAWVKIPLTGFKIEDRKVYPVITSAGFDFKYTDICRSVGDFICGIHLSDAVLQANPALKVKLELGLSKTYDDALAADKFVGVDQPYVYDVDDLTSAVAVVGSEYFTSFADAVTAAIASGEEVKVVADAVVSDEVVINNNLSVDLNGKTLRMAADASIKVENAAVKLVGGTFADLSAANIALSGNATLTLPAKVDGDFGSHFTSENSDGSFSIATKFQSYIQVVDGEPCIGFLKDTDRATKYKLMGKTALDDGSDWAEVSVEAAAEAVANPLVPLYWAKPAGGYRFFKVVIAE